MSGSSLRFLELFYATGNFISCRIKKDAPLWMRTQRSGNQRLPGKWLLTQPRYGAAVGQSVHVVTIQKRKKFFKLCVL